MCSSPTRFFMVVLIIPVRLDNRTIQLNPRMTLPIMFQKKERENLLVLAVESVIVNRDTNLICTCAVGIGHLRSHKRIFGSVKLSRDQNNPGCILPNPPKHTGPMKPHCPPVRKTPTAARHGTYTHTNHPKMWRVLNTPIVAIATNMAIAASPVHHTVSRKSNNITILASWCAAPIIPKPATASHK